MLVLEVCRLRPSGTDARYDLTDDTSSTFDCTGTPWHDDLGLWKWGTTADDSGTKRGTRSQPAKGQDGCPCQLTS